MRRKNPSQPKRNRLKKAVELASFPELNPNPISEVDLDGQIYYLNPAARRLFPALETKGLDHPWLADWESVADSFRNVKTKSMLRQVTIDGRCYQQAMNYIAGIQRVRIYGLDITERERAGQALRETRDYLQNLIGYANAPIIVWNPDFRITQFNRAFERLTGRKAAEVIGKELDILLPLSRRDESMAHIRRTATGERWETIEIPIQHVDGSVRTVLWNSATLFAPDDKTPIATIAQGQDISELKKKEQELARLNRTLRALSNINQAMMRVQGEPEFLLRVCQIVVEDCGHAMVWIGYAEEDEAKTVRPVAYAGFEEGYLDTLKITWADTERGRGPTGTAIRTGKPSACRNMLTDPKFKPWREEALKRGYASSIVFPLMASGKTFGAITIYSREPDPFSEDEVKLLSELADDLAFGIAANRLRVAHAQAEEALRASRDDLERIVAERTAELQLANARLRSLTQDIVSTQEEERRSVSRELHDEAGQGLTALKLSLQMMLDELPSGWATYRQHLGDAVVLTDKTLEHIRMLAQDLRPPALESAGLNATLEGLCCEFAHRTQIQINYSGTELPDLGPATICLYRLLQEALTNAARHGHATEIQVRLEKDAELVCLSVEDNGQGFDTQKVFSDQGNLKSMGLIGMQERIKMVGGRLEIYSTSGCGTRLIAHVPLEEA